MDHDLEQKLPVDTYSGDKGYDDGIKIYISGTVRLTFCHPPEENLHRKERRQQTGLAGVERNTRIKQGLNERYKIERKFGEGGHGLGRCRYVGMLVLAVQAFMTAIMLNLKRMVKLLTGVGFKTQAASAA